MLPKLACPLHGASSLQTLTEATENIPDARSRSSSGWSADVTRDIQLGRRGDDAMAAEPVVGGAGEVTGQVYECHRLVDDRMWLCRRSQSRSLPANWACAARIPVSPVTPVETQCRVGRAVRLQLVAAQQVTAGAPPVRPRQLTVVLALTDTHRVVAGADHHRRRQPGWVVGGSVLADQGLMARVGRHWQDARCDRRRSAGRVTHVSPRVRGAGTRCAC